MPPEPLDPPPTAPPFAVWSPADGVWLTGQGVLFGSKDAWSRTWPRWASTVAGRASRPAWLGRLIAASGSSCSPGPLLRTPLASDSDRGGETIAQLRARGAQLSLYHQLGDLAANPGPEPSRPWREFQDAADHWAAAAGREPPPPWEPGPRTGRPRPSAAAVEWMMGWPEGLVTDPALGLSRRAQLRILGNGVVPQQAALALRVLIAAAARLRGGTA